MHNRRHPLFDGAVEEQNMVDIVQLMPAAEEGVSLGSDGHNEEGVSLGSDGRNGTSGSGHI
jgi:hypothetical protein